MTDDSSDETGETVSADRTSDSRAGEPERGDEAATVDFTGEDQPAITCALTDEQTERRLEWVRETLLPYLRTIDEREDGFAFVFDRNPDAYAAVAEAAWIESDCCGWAAFEVELPPDGEPIRWHVRSDREPGVAFLDDALRETVRELDGVRLPEIAGSGTGADSDESIECCEGCC